MTLYKSTITIWSDFNPALVELSRLAEEAETGSALCTEFQPGAADPSGDPNEEALREFFFLDEDDDS